MNPQPPQLPTLTVVSTELDALLDYIDESSTISEGVRERVLRLCQAYARAALEAQKAAAPELVGLSREPIDRLIAALDPSDGGYEEIKRWLHSITPPAPPQGADK